MLSIPSDVYALYKEGVDLMISEFGVTCTLEYTSKLSVIGAAPAVHRRNTMNPVAGNNTFNKGSSSFKEVITTDSITMRVYWSKKDWIRVGEFENPDTAAQSIAYKSDLLKIKRSSKVKIDNGEEFQLILAGEPVPHGILQDRYIICNWKRA